MEWSALDTGCASVECASVIQDTEENIVAALAKIVDNQTTEEAWNVNRLILNNFYEHKKIFLYRPKILHLEQLHANVQQIGTIQKKDVLAARS